MAIPISAIVLTKNEEEMLPGCLESLAWADEILVVDSFSTDRTVEIARRAGARVVQHPFANFAAQRNYAQTQARYDWVLFIDADERVSEELRDEIRYLAATDRLSEFNAYHIQRVHLCSGRWIPDPTRRRVTPRLRAWIRCTEVPRLFDRRLAIWERPLHEVVRVPEPHGVLGWRHLPSRNDQPFTNLWVLQLLHRFGGGLSASFPQPGKPDRGHCQGDTLFSLSLLLCRPLAVWGTGPVVGHYPGLHQVYELRQVVRTDPHPERAWNLDRAGPAVVRPVSRGRSNPLSVKGLFRRHDGGDRALSGVWFCRCTPGGFPTRILLCPLLSLPCCVCEPYAFG